MAWIMLPGRGLPAPADHLLPSPLAVSDGRGGLGRQAEEKGNVHFPRGLAPPVHTQAVLPASPAEEAISDRLHGVCVCVCCA